MAFAPVLEALIARCDLDPDGARALIGRLMDPDSDDAAIAGVLIALRCKGVTGTELAAFASVLRERSLGLSHEYPTLVDTCGTGGGRPSFNLSTGAAIVAAAAGARVAKHGNRAVTSSCGSADVLEALGVVLHADPEHLAHVLERTGIAFLFAPLHHPGVKHVGAARKALGVRTVFNLLGPLANPAGAKRQLIGVYDAALMRPMAEALRDLGCEHGLVVHGGDALDEISPCAPTRAIAVRPDELVDIELTPEDFGIAPISTADTLPGSDLAENAALLREALSEPKSPRSHALLPNAGAALVLAGVADSWMAGGALARKTVESGAALALLDELVSLTRDL